MSYKNDSLLVISNKYGKASGDAKVELFETYDKLRDITVSGSMSGGSGTGIASSFFMNLARIVAPSSFLPIMGNESINIPGTSYSSPISGGNGVVTGNTSAFGYNGLGTYTSFPTGGAASIGLMQGIGGNYSSDFAITGGAASMVQAVPAAGAVAGMASGYGFGSSIVIPLAGVISGIGGLATAMSPYLGPYGLGALAAGSVAQGLGGAVLGGYQHVSGRILNNADTILTSKVKNIETVVKMLDTQSDIIKKMLKESMDGDSKAIQNL